MDGIHDLRVHEDDDGKWEAVAHVEEEQSERPCAPVSTDVVKAAGSNDALRNVRIPAKEGLDWDGSGVAPAQQDDEECFTGTDVTNVEGLHDHAVTI